MSIFVKHVGHWHQSRTNAGQHRERVMHAQIFIHRDPDNGHLCEVSQILYLCKDHHRLKVETHPSSSHISNQRHRSQRGSCERLICVDDVLIAAYEDAKNAEAEEDTCNKRTPYRNRTLPRGQCCSALEITRERSYITSLVQPIQKSEIGMEGAPSIANQSRNSGGRKLPPCSLILAKSRFAQP